MNTMDKDYQKPGAELALQRLKEGNLRFISGKSEHPHTSKKRLQMAAAENQAKFAFATVLSCSDSRVPVERIFDAGIMDLFVIRVAGNVCQTNEIGSIEYGLCQVQTPLLVVLGHTRCGAVTAAVEATIGTSISLERNIPHLLNSLQPAVQKSLKKNKSASEKKLIATAIEENIWNSIENLFLKSPATRDLVRYGHIKVIGAIYNLDTGVVTWLDEAKITEILKKADTSMNREIDPVVLFPNS